MVATVLGEDNPEDAPVFVLVHGLGMSRRYMMPTAVLLAEFGRVYVPDLPGFGDSGKNVKALTIPELSDSLVDWMTDLGLGPVIWLGNSLGAQVLIDFSTRHPEHAAAAILVGPTIDPEARKISIQLLRLLGDVFLEPADLYMIAVVDYLRAGLRRNIQTLRDALEDPILTKLPQIRCPVLIIRGGRDPIVPEGWVEQAARLVPESRLVTIPRAAHAVNFNSPEHLVAEVTNFLRVAGKVRVEKR